MGLSFISTFYKSINLAFWIALFHLIIPHFATSSLPLYHSDECSDLLQFKQSFVINKSASLYPYAYPKVASWDAKANGDCCSWDGVTCDEVTGHVIKLDLTSSFLYGSINSSSSLSLSRLVYLECLSLADNDFNHSEIPLGIMNLTRLSHLDLSFSIFSGQIPSEILKLSKLVSLNISQNDFELQNWGLLTSLPDALTNLKLLDLTSVNLSSSIPRTLANLSSLSYLSLKDCGLQGEFPINIFQLPNLRLLNVQDNRDVTGYLPEFTKNCPLEDLRLARTGFSGGIPSSIGNLKYLSSLYISECSFTSGKNLSSLGNLTKLTQLDISMTDLGENQIPSWLVNMIQLTDLIMSGNNLSGPIPYWLLNFNQLTYLDLAYNRLTGHIPFEIRNLTQLTHLDLGSNRLEGQIPSSFFDLKNLDWLDLRANNLSGVFDLDRFLPKLRNLQVLILSSNNLSLLIENKVHTHSQKFDAIGLRSCSLSLFPYFLQKQEQLQFLDLSSNKIAGPIPRWLLHVSIHSLAYLNLSYNLLTGFDHQHPVLLPWTSLANLDLSSNKLQGPLPIPPEFTSSYLVSKNQLVGEVPDRICSLSRLYVLDLSYNNLSGTLPQCLGSFSNELSILTMQGNKFHGSIPQTFMNGSNLKMIDLSRNQFQGGIPKSLANCSKLEFLNLGNNQINDIFPYWLGILPQLKILVLQWNRLYGVIGEPKSNFEFSKLHIIDLSHNRFTGTLPLKYFQLWNAMKVVNISQLKYIEYDLMVDNYLYRDTVDASVTMSNKGIDLKYEKLSSFLTAIVLSSNKFEGEIPTSIGNLKGLHNLNLSNNNLRGRIPSALGNLVVLESLDISNNRLSGEIPQQLAELTSLEVFDVSHNQLRGPLPQGKQFNTFENTSYDGNPGLCGKPLSKKCETSEAAQTDEDHGSSSPFAFGWKIVLIGYACGLIIGVVLGYIFSKRKHELFTKTFGWLLKSMKRD